MEAKPKTPILLTRNQCAHYLGVSLTTLANWKDKEYLIPLGIGRRVYYSLESITEALIKLENKTL